MNIKWDDSFESSHFLSLLQNLYIRICSVSTV